jgi:hypothetical protein
MISYRQTGSNDFLVPKLTRLSYRHIGTQQSCIFNLSTPNNLSFILFPLPKTRVFQFHAG